MLDIQDHHGLTLFLCAYVYKRFWFLNCDLCGGRQKQKIPHLKSAHRRTTMAVLNTIVLAAVLGNYLGPDLLAAGILLVHNESDQTNSLYF